MYASYKLSVQYLLGRGQHTQTKRKEKEPHRILTNKYKYLPLIGLHYSHVMDEQFVALYRVFHDFRA
jgi:hypothetical protein